MMKKFFFAAILLTTGLIQSTQVFAETKSFEVTVSPDTITVWEFADLTITAIDENGNRDQSFVNEVYMEVDGLDVFSDDIELPSLWFYKFKASDQWEKPFSKGFTIKKAGTYEIVVNDLLSDISNITWSATVKVNEEGSGPAVWTIEVSSPVANSEIADEKIQVVANTSLLNNQIILYVDDEKTDERLSDQNGDITMFISWIEPGEHNLLLNAVDLWGTVLASSEVIPFTYTPVDHGSLFVGLEILPSNTVIEWDKVTIKITTADVVDSVTVKIGDGEALPTSKTGKGVFTKELLMESAWVYSVDLWLSVNGTITTQEDADTITVNKDEKKIITLVYEPVLQQDKVWLNWTFAGRVEYFKMMYGMNKNNLDLSLTSTIPSGTILLTDPTKTRYAQVFPTDKDGTVVGDPSPVVTINPLRDPDPVCGNRIIEEGEACDDGNTVNSDGCSALCIIETAVCGNRRIELGEECDDGNTLDGDGCNPACKIESAVCGNRRIELGEECDDGNVLDNDGCSSVCKIQEVKAAPVPEPEPIQECETAWIVLNTKTVGDKHYLFWAPVNNAKNYLVYRQENRPWSISQMSLVWETSDPIFEYPFDPAAQVDQYAWYAVEAVCDDGQKVQLGDFEKVKVGPEQTLLLILLSVMMLWGFRMMKMS